MRRYKTGVIGLGYIGNVHIEALLRLGVEVIAVADSNLENCRAAREKYGIKKSFSSYMELIDDDEVEVIHNCTPNNMHYEINKYAIERKKHVLCEKPLALTSRESQELIRLADENKVITAVNFNYRYYPVVQHARQMVEDNELGRVNIIQGYYLQDWLFFDTDYNWRLEPEIGGVSRAIADIGSHWCDLAQYVSGLKIIEVMADLKTIHPVRKKPGKAGETFSKSNADDYEERIMINEDYGSVLVRFENDVRGMFSVSQVSAGRKCKLRLELYGSGMSLTWDHERANELWIGHRDQANEILMKDPALLNEAGRKFAHYPGGHPEGYPSAPMNLFLDYYSFMHSVEQNKFVTAGFPRFTEGHNQMQITEAILKSSKTRQWVCI